MPYISLAISFAIILVIFLRWGWSIMNWVWLQPRCLEKCLREMGFRGNSYRLLVGDMKEVLKMDEEAKSKAIKFSHDIVPRIMPFIHKTIIDYGECNILNTCATYHSLWQYSFVLFCYIYITMVSESTCV